MSNRPELDFTAVTLSLSICFQPLQLTREYFTKELKRRYQGYNNTDVLTSTWNAIMTTVRLRAESFHPVAFSGSLPACLPRLSGMSVRGTIFYG